VVDALVNTMGTEVAALLIERGDGSIKLSLRGRAGTSPGLDVAKLAKQIHPMGGGHPKAAGTTVHGSLDHAERVLCDALTAWFEQQPSVQDHRS
jgi:nanoRNase/pAp phosphatase (c-di-AMP/oligoRNAs hydrolase)